MTSPARSFSLLLLAAALCFAACDDKNKPTPTPTEQDLYGNAARPTWTVSEDYDYSSSMTAVIAVHQLCGVALSDSAVGSNDLLAAFIGEECHGIAAYDDGLFYLYIAGPTGNGQEAISNDQLTIKYWSARYTNLFVTEPIPFVNDTQLGSTAEPYKPVFVTATK